MLSLLQTLPSGEGVFIPGWMLGVFGAFLLILLAVIGWFMQNMVADLKTVINEAVRAFQAFKEEAPKEFVTYPFFELARQELKEGSTRAHKRISELRDELLDHSKNCPVVRNLSENRGRSES